MNYEAKNIYAGFASTVTIFTVYFIVVSGMYDAGRFEGAAGTALLGKAILALMGGGILVHIVMTILATIVFAIILKDPKPSFVVDERDKLIELRGLRVSYYVFGAGYVAAMVAMAMGVSVFWVFNLLLVFCALSALVEGVVKLALYHRGF
ncbi:MAG TPA: hypothetical protein EYG79_07260 [Rhodobacteraceae bacterium]|nr:hypothetical protein [Paracoccaceae bacterium]